VGNTLTHSWLAFQARELHLPVHEARTAGSGSAINCGVSAQAETSHLAIHCRQC
jgi:hypothetical protein